MGIQQRLKQQRYGEHYILMPDKKEIKRTNCYSDGAIKYMLLRDDIPNQVIQLYTNAKGDKYRKYYIKTINDYNTYRENQNNLTRLTQRILYDKLLYFYKHNQRYSSFEQYAIAWIVGGMFEMRNHIMRKKFEKGEIPLLVGKRHTSMASGFYPYPKPMGNKAMLELAYKMHRLLYRYVELRLD